MKTRITRPRLVTVQVGEQSQEIQAPGFKSIRRGDERQFYWIKDDHAEFALYEPKTVRIHVGGLDPEAAGERIQRICQREQEAMLAWADGNASDRERLGPKYDGTLKSVIELYRNDDESSFPNLKDNTKQSYRDSLKIVAETIGLRRLDRLHPKNFRRYYNNWREPAEPGGEERTRRAYGCIQMVRVMLSYGIEADIPECKRLRDGLSRMSFEKNPPREEIMSFEQAKSIVDLCLKENDVSMALTQAVAFDCMFRQGDIRGDWREESLTYVLRPGEVRRGSKIWSGMTIDQMQPGRVLSVRTSKTGQPVAHAIDKCTLVMRCLERLDRSNPLAPVAARPDGKPWFANDLPVIYSFQPGPMPNDVIAAIVLRRKEGVEGLPYAFFVLGYGNEVYQLVMPTEKDKDIAGKKLDLVTFPTPGSPDPSRFPKTGRAVLNLGSTEVVKGESYPVTMGFDAIVWKGADEPPSAPAS